MTSAKAAEGQTFLASLDFYKRKIRLSSFAGGTTLCSRVYESRFTRNRSVQDKFGVERCQKIVKLAETLYQLIFLN